MIAHRLSSIVDFDSVAVINEGELVEIGEPVGLLKNGSSHFSRLYNGLSWTLELLAAPLTCKGLACFVIASNMLLD